MRVKIESTVPNSTEPILIQAPPSKSIAHRMLICAAIAGGESTIRGLELSEDIKATIDCLKTLGAGIELTEEKSVESNVCDLYTAKVRGIKGLNIEESEAGATEAVATEAVVTKAVTNEVETAEAEPAKHLSDPQIVRLNCNESGSTLRFMIPVVTLLFYRHLLDESQSVRFTGAGRLLSRPLDVYDKLFEYTFVNFTHNPDCVDISGYLRAGDYTLEGNVSSQFITGMLLTLPSLSGNSRIHLVPPVESRPYIDITIDVLRQFGVEVIWENENTLYMAGDQIFRPIDTTVEGDWSNGAILYTLAVLQRDLGRNVVLTGLREESIQGDKAFLAMKDEIDKGNKTVDISDCPDLGPILMVYLAMKGGGTLTGTSRLSIKESDRGHAMKQELEKMGATVSVEGNDIHVISEGGLHAPTDIIDSHNDHRIAMSMAVLCSVFGGEIDGADAVNKSFPAFYESLKKVGVNIKC